MKRRTAFVTAASVVGVVLAGGTAIGANIGILSATEASPVGELSAAVPIASPVEPVVVDVFLDETDTAVAPAPTGTTKFVVEDAGTVAVDRLDGAIRLGKVDATSGWTWSSSQTSDTNLRVTFASGDTTYEFIAVLGPNGTIEARVDQPIVETVPSGPAFGYDDDDYEDDEHDEHDDDEHDEHDDDEEDEYEGGDDDD